VCRSVRECATTPMSYDLDDVAAARVQLLRPHGATTPTSYDGDDVVPAHPDRPPARTPAAPQTGSRMVVSTSTTCGIRGIEANPNATGGSSGANDPSDSPAQVPRTPVTSCAPVTP
jgi:hypothetical protein